MGLDLSAEGSDISPHWSYSGFGCFRERLAEHIGIDLHDMHGFGGETPWESIDHGLVPLLNHSDCDGELDPAACGVVAPALREAVAGFGDEFDDYDRHGGESLAELMEHCARSGVALKFH